MFFFSRRAISLVSLINKLNCSSRLHPRLNLQLKFSTEKSVTDDFGAFRNSTRDPLGYIPSHVWSTQRPPDVRLESLLFKNIRSSDMKSEADEERFMATAFEAKLSGQPVTTELSYSIADTVPDIPHLDRRLQENLFRMGLNQLAPIQRHAIGLMSIDDVVRTGPNNTQSQENGVDPVLERVVGRYDLMTAAQTGSGKTLAYLIPMVNRLLRVYPFEAMQSRLKAHRSRQFPSSLILAPTRELVQQILAEASKLCYRTFVRPVGLYGGERPSRQLFELSRGGHVIVATPGRLLDFLQQEVLHLEHCRMLVLDEADRMLDMGFEEQLRKILQAPRFGMPSASDLFRQTCLYSATFPREVTLVAKDFLRGSRCISLTLHDREQNVGTVVPEWGSRAPKTDSVDEVTRLSRIVPREIEQSVELISGGPHGVQKRLIEFISQLVAENTNGSTNDENLPDSVGQIKPTQECRVLVFCNTKRQVDNVDAALFRSGLRTAPIHGDKSQAERSKALELFRRGSINVLVASSVAARGLDIPNVRAVVNMGLPVEVEDYVHRIGRTGRMGHSGFAVTLISDADVPQMSPQVARGVLQLIQKSTGSLDSVHPELLGFVETQKNIDHKAFGKKPYRSSSRSGGYGGRSDSDSYRKNFSSNLLDNRYR